MKESYNLKINVYMEPEIYKAHVADIFHIAEVIYKSCGNIGSVVISEQAGGIWVGGCYPGNSFWVCHYKVNYEWDNVDEVLKEFIKNWNPDGKKHWDQFIDDGEKYGW